VLLWPDTFNNHFFPGTLDAAAEVLHAAGYAVDIPRRPLCCGRPLYDWGMLERARSLLRGVLDALRAPIAAGTPVVVPEPSCLAVFRDELREMLPDDPDANRLAGQSYLLGEFLQKFAPDIELRRLDGKALLHGHCHQKAIAGMAPDTALLERIGVRCEQPEAGCCGMAGSFGFERGERYDVSMRIAERRLLPAAREAPPATLLIADGFSCREQIVQGAGRRPLHLAEVLRMALPLAETPAREEEREAVRR
jgi:Fe-S oxidoreductase